MGGLTGRSVLVVEDEPLLAMLLEEQLAEAGARVIGPSTTPAEALACLARELPDAAVLDRNLGGEDSLPVATELIRRGIPFMVVFGSDEAARAVVKVKNVLTHTEIEVSESDMVARLIQEGCQPVVSAERGFLDALAIACTK
jgi:CheY-like chemotaxis protein